VGKRGRSFGKREVSEREKPYEALVWGYYRGKTDPRILGKVRIPEGGDDVPRVPYPFVVLPGSDQEVAERSKRVSESSHGSRRMVRGASGQKSQRLLRFAEGTSTA